MPENNELLTTSTEKRVITIRGKQVILDRDLADLYGVTTSRLNEQVKRNIKRFPGQFRFQLTKEETSELIANCDRLEQLKHSAQYPAIDISIFNRSHDRFLIIDDLVYHIGASLKDLGNYFSNERFQTRRPDIQNIIAKFLVP